jgi:malonyl-CoA O-methyltransferase
MTAPRLVLVHGWGFDVEAWRPLERALGGIETQAVDLGFFGRPRIPAFDQSKPLVAVGHSLGFLWLLRERPFPWRALVSIAGMPRFTRGPHYPHGVGPRVLRRMMARFACEPAATWRDFLARCGCPREAAGEGRSSEMDVDRLGEGLRWLAEWDERRALARESTPLLALAAEDDAILPAALSEAVFAERPGTAFHRAEGGGHALVLSRPEWCAARIRSFLAALETTPRASPRAPRLAKAEVGEPGLPRREKGPMGGPALALSIEARLTARKAEIARSFDAAAETYDDHAAVQREVARRLADRIARQALPPAPRILEVGCGTGLLSEALLERLPGARCLFTDLSPAMVRRCREKLYRLPGVGFAIMDGEAPAVGVGFDLVVSSFALQWFLDLGRALDRLAGCLRPGGRLVFATLGAETFTQWRAAHAAVGLSYGGIALPTAAALVREIHGPEGPGAVKLAGAIEEQRIVRRYPHAFAFLHELKALGADVPQPGHRPLDPGSLRRLLRRLAGGEETREGFAVTYHVLYGSFVNAALPRAAPRLGALAAPSG